MAFILVVDDEESICFTFRLFLEQAGYDVQTASSCAGALTVIDGQTPDLIFADIMLGGPSGIDLLREVRHRGLTMPFILITGEPSMETAVEALALGADEYLYKPVDKDKLLLAAERWLRYKYVVDQKQRLEREKDELRRHLETVFNAVPDAIVTVSSGFTVLSVNEACRNILGMDTAAAGGQPCDKALGSAAAECMPLLREAVRAGHIVQRGGVAVQHDRGEIIVDISAVPLACAAAATEHSPGTDAAGGVMLIVRDVTRLTGLERALAAQHIRRSMIGRSSVMRGVFRLVESLADTDTTVLVTGESGTGKELVADALHHSGARAQGPFVKVNCSALSETLLESELFGHVRGAFTGATKDRTGRIQMAHGGTLFLDEIGDISPSVQLKLLRVLQEKEIERVGEGRPVKVDVRVVAATNKSLRALVARGKFREDLYYRLKVVEVHLPALRERREDIPLLAEHFIEEFNEHFHRRVSGLDSSAQQLLVQYDWPGNVRELRHAVEHAFIMAGGNVIPAAALPAELMQSGRFSAQSAGTGALRHDAPDAAAQGAEWKQRLSAALKETGGNKAKAARLLGISRQTMYRRLRELGM